MTEYHFDSDVSRVLLSRADGFDQRSNGSFWHGVGPIVSTFEREGRRSDAITLRDIDAASLEGVDPPARSTSCDRTSAEPCFDFG